MKIDARSLIRGVLAAALVAAIFFFALPKIADFSSVWREMKEMSWIEIAVLAAIAGWNIVTYWFVMLAALPGSNVWQAMKVNQASTAVANTLPAGGALGIGVTYGMYSQYGFTRAEIGLSILVSGIWNNFVKLGMPLVALALLALGGDAGGSLVLAAGAGVLLLVITIGLAVTASRSEKGAVAIGSALGKGVSVVRKLVRKPPVSWAEPVARLRRDTIELVRARWLPLTIASVVSHVGLYLVLLATLRAVGVSEIEVSWVDVLAAFAFVRLLSALPITPGGLGVVELGLSAALVKAGGDEAQVVASVLVYRALTYLLPVPFGAVLYVKWRRGSAARKARVSAVSASLLLVLAGCSGSAGPPVAKADAGTDPAIVVGAYDFGESEVLGEVYASALERAGYEVRRVKGVASRELMEPALEQGKIDLVLEYQGTLLTFLRARAVPTSDPEETHRLLVPAAWARGIAVLDRAAAENRNEIVMRTATAARWGVKSISDLVEVAKFLTFGGPPECPTRPLCLRGLERVYGLDFERFVPLDAGGPMTLAALRGGDVDVGLLFTTNPVIGTPEFVALEDDLGLQPAENIVPVIRNDVLAARGPELERVLNQVTSRIEPADLRWMNLRVDGLGESAHDVAARWLDAEGIGG